MNKIWMTMCLLVSLAAAATAANVPQTPQPLTRTLANARYVYVTSYDGDQFNTQILPEDRDAILAVQNSIQQWGKLVVVYHPEQADIVMMVQSRPSEDTLAVYEAHGWPGASYLWREMGRDGLQAGETPLVTDFRTALEKTVK